MTLETIAHILWGLTAFGLIVLVLLHSPKGDGLGGLGGQAQLFTSTKSAELTLNRMTWTLTALFLALTVVLSAQWLSPVEAAPGAPATSAPLTAPAPDAPANPAQ
ncbi:preprotein translocase subunit SecG [Leptolyngbya sp. PL-A3]|nr:MULTISPECIES: preprotein translocase subunit SecG [unclassified Leptolyngbya]MBD1914165.1 preprotein translocase subunit SecG [Leptolyngbya sp. FACHB-8]MBD2157172.1 preprotein translocase subunit SecG [Leptolyngbya sp. FACHB-16]